MEDCLRVVVTGEVDSGKSTLIGRFLYESGSLSNGVIEDVGDVCRKLGSDFEFAYLLDSFEEERRGQLTIDTTQVFCKVKRSKEFVFIDVPGHKELIRNMLCGSSYADIAILVVDIDKSMAEQTRGHAFILKFLGIEHIIVVFNKMDSVGFDEKVFRNAKESAAEFLKKIGIQSKYFIPISAKQGDNLLKESKKMDWYKGLSLVDALNNYSKEIKVGDFRFPVQDIYDLDGGKIAVGRIISGTIKKRDTVRILPLDKERKVKTIRVFNKNQPFLDAPKSIGLILDDMQGLARGQIICKQEFPGVFTEVRSKIFCLQPLDKEEKLIFKCVTQKTPAQIKQINWICNIENLESRSGDGQFQETDIAQVLIVTEHPVVVESFAGNNSLGRFVLQGNNKICAVGTVLQN